MPGGVGGGSREASPYPDQQTLPQTKIFESSKPLNRLAEAALGAFEPRERLRCRFSIDSDDRREFQK